MKDAITRHIESNDLMSTTQHGFRSGRSVQTNMIEFMNQMTKWLDEGKSFDILYLDFAKAFDKVCHERILLKLESVGIGGKVLRWLKDWLSGRRQRVGVDGAYSGWEAVVSSVLQGSVLGGVLFNIFIDDIDEGACSGDDNDGIVRKFADDTKIARIVECREDGERMQEQINEVLKWANTWEMQFNVKKCKVLHCGRNNPRTSYTMGGVELGQAKEERDLGIIIDETLKPSRQCAAAAKAENYALGQLLRAFHFRKKANLIPLFKTFVRPRLEFAAAAWSPWTEVDVKPMLM